MSLIRCITPKVSITCQGLSACRLTAVRIRSIPSTSTASASITSPSTAPTFTSSSTRSFTTTTPSHVSSISTPSPTSNLRHVTTLASLSETEIYTILRGAASIKKSPSMYTDCMKNDTLIMLFEKPSLRTRLSFEVGMTQLGGHAIYYPLDANAPLGKKESIADTSRVLSRYATLVMARIKSRHTIEELAKYSTIPVINALDDWGHPCQLLADYQTMIEHLPNPSPYPLRGLRIAYIGDVANNVTYDVIRGAAILGQHLTLAGPKGEEYQVNPEIVAEFAHLSVSSGATLRICPTAIDASRDVDIVMTDSWMSYGIDTKLEAARKALFMPFQVTDDVMKVAKKSAKFMHCLPALRGAEVSASVIDGPQSIVFDEAENRLHAQKALMLWLTHRL